MVAGITIESMQNSLEPVQTLRCHDPLDIANMGMAGLHSMARSKFKRSLSKRKSSDFLLEASLGQQGPRTKRLRDTRKTGATKLVQVPLPQNVMKFTISNHARHDSFEFSLDSQWACRGIKRCRLGSDVEGPNTATLSRKKRRLRSQLITSRLSRPFSQPATHILNRQARQVGDRRFVKMAVTFDSSKRAAHLQATSYLRYSVMNRLRRRLGIVKQHDSPKDDDENLSRHSMDTSTKAPWQTRDVGQTPETKHTATLEKKNTNPDSHPAAASTQEPDAQSAQALGKAPACRLSKPIALPLPSADIDATGDRSSARIDSTTSPEPRPPLAWMYDDHEEDSFAFLHLDEEHSSDDDSEHVYCDFDTLFAAKASSPDAQSPDEHTYEEYMDELDGISWRIG